MFVEIDWVKPQKFSVSVAGLRAGIWKQDLMNTKQMC
jgi:hypothetical protein